MAQQGGDNDNDDIGDIDDDDDDDSDSDDDDMVINAAKPQKFYVQFWSMKTIFNFPSFLDQFYCGCVGNHKGISLIAEHYRFVKYKINCPMSDVPV